MPRGQQIAVLSESESNAEISRCVPWTIYVIVFQTVVRVPLLALQLFVMDTRPY